MALARSRISNPLILIKIQLVQTNFNYKMQENSYFHKRMKNFILPA